MAIICIEGLLEVSQIFLLFFCKNFKVIPSKLTCLSISILPCGLRCVCNFFFFLKYWTCKSVVDLNADHEYLIIVV